MAKDILEKECSLKVARTRFWVGDLSWPLNLVCFEGTERWAYFDGRFLQLGLNKKIAGRVKDSILRDLLRHELAHYFVRIHHGLEAKPHGEEFHEMCRRYGWPEQVAKASGDLFDIHEATEGDLVADSVVEKVKKLLALSTSDNPHEAEQATLRANQLIMRHHLSRAAFESGEKTLCVLPVLSASKKSAKLTAIYDILTHFMVRPLLHYGRGEVRLEAIGSREQVLLAEYVALFLDREFEQLWKRAGLKGMRAKNSFFIGLARGYREKLEGARKEMPQEDSKALVRVEHALGERIKNLMGGFSSSRSGQVLDGEALGRGTHAGRGLSILPAMKEGKGLMRALPFLKS